MCVRVSFHAEFALLHEFPHSVFAVIVMLMLLLLLLFFHCALLSTLSFCVCAIVKQRCS